MSTRCLDLEQRKEKTTALFIWPSWQDIKFHNLNRKQSQRETQTNHANINKNKAGQYCHQTKFKVKKEKKELKNHAHKSLSKIKTYFA